MYAELALLIDYDPITGFFTWRANGGPRARKGARLNSIDKRGYRVVFYKKAVFKLHRLAWFIQYGELPEYGIDHKDHDKLNTAIKNLRDVPQIVNGKNISKKTNNISGITGVSWKTRNKKWQASIKVNGKDKYLGLFTNLFDAACARKQAEIQYGFHLNHGK